MKWISIKLALLVVFAGLCFVGFSISRTVDAALDETVEVSSLIKKEVLPSITLLSELGTTVGHQRVLLALWLTDL